MIPKIIHYCWFGGKPLPKEAQKCIASWRKYLPDYEIKEWNESNFDVRIIPYTAEAFQAKKYAFVSDYARLWILYNYGGLYFDTDVEVIRPLSEIISDGPFMGCEDQVFSESESTEFSIGVNPGLGIGLGTGPEDADAREFYKDLLNSYINRHFLLEDGRLNDMTIVVYTTELLRSYGLEESTETQLVSGIHIYPKDFFCPINYLTGVCTLTENTVSIHHYSASWLPWQRKVKDWIYFKLVHLLGKENIQKITSIYK